MIRHKPWPDKLKLSFQKQHLGKGAILFFSKKQQQIFLPTLSGFLLSVLLLFRYV
jgi:hypothetical protein